MVIFWFVAFTVGLGFLMGRFAESKGYGFWNWFFASSLIGIIWLVTIPNMKNNATLSQEDVIKKVGSSNVAGVVLSVIGQLIALANIATYMNAS